ncbi:MAG: hypothetical protein WCB46_12535 [Methanoregula sp.]
MRLYQPGKYYFNTLCPVNGYFIVWSKIFSAITWKKWLEQQSQMGDRAI